MPATRVSIALCATILACSLSAGCTSTELAANALAASSAPDPELPDSVDVSPMSARGTAAVNAGPQGDSEAPPQKSELAAISPQDAAVASVSGPSDAALAAAAAASPVGYAGASQQAKVAAAAFSPSGPVGARSPELDLLIAKYAVHYGVPVELVRRVVKRESNFDPAARNRIYWGLMQIRHDTAQTMGYRGSAEGLLDAETNLRFAVKYLRGAYITAEGDHDRAVRFYASGYYYDAKRKGLLTVTGLRS